MSPFVNVASAICWVEPTLSLLGIKCTFLSPGDRLNIKTPSNPCRNFHYKYKTVLRSSDLNNRNPYPKSRSLYWNGVRMVMPIGTSLYVTQGSHTSSFFFKVYDGTNATAPLLGRFGSRNGPDVLSTGPFLFIRFTSDYVVTHRGFKLRYKGKDHTISCSGGYAIVEAIQGCGDHHVIHSHLQ